MPLSPAFTASQSGLSPSVITLTDTSTGSDVNIAARRVYFQTSEGVFLVSSGNTQSYELWPITDTFDPFNVLDQDYSLNIIVQWVDGGGVVLYTLAQEFCFPQFNKNFFYYLIQLEAITPEVIQDTVYFSNLATYWMRIVGAMNAITFGADIAASQNCLNRATFMMRHQNDFF